MDTGDHHQVAVRQEFLDKNFAGDQGANVRVTVTYSQIAGKAGINRSLQLEVTQPKKRNGAIEETRIRKELSVQDTAKFTEAMDQLVGVADDWKSTPSQSRTVLEFATSVSDGIEIGRRTTKERRNEYFIEASEGERKARCAIGGIEQLNEFCATVHDGELLIR